MTEFEFRKLALVNGDYIMIHTTSGSTWDGCYAGNFDNSTLEFDFENHNNGKFEKICITNLHSIVRKKVF